MKSITMLIALFSLCASLDVKAAEPEVSFLGCDGKNWQSFAKFVDSHLVKSFESKFRFITPDIFELSNQNLKNLKTAITHTRDAFRYIDEAKVLAKSIDKQLTVVHSTSAESALKIISAGSIMSREELARQKILPLTNNYNNTSVFTDGQIGEQDVVYLALQERSNEGKYGFGEVTFVFNKAKIMDKAYFSLSSFSAGSPFQMKFNKQNLGNCDLRIFSQMVDNYKPLVFNGRSYRKLLITSALQFLKDKNNSELTTLGKDAKYLSDDHYRLVNIEQMKASQSGTHAQTVVLPPDVDITICRILEVSGQTKDCAALHLTDQQKLRALNGFTKESSSEVNSVLNSFRMFPRFDETSLPLLFDSYHGFWEVKIPRKLSLSTLEEIIVPKESSETFEAAIKSLAITIRKSYSKSTMPGGNQRFIFHERLRD